MKTGMKKRVVALALAALMVVGLVPTGFGAVGAKAAAGTLTADAESLATV